ECGAPEFYGGGLKLVSLAGEGGKIAPETFQRALEAGQWGGPHHVSPTVLSLSQATEAGTIYRPDEIRALAEIAHARGMSVHVDGARIGNALARMNASPAQATWMAGGDVLSFGATQGGALAAEAVVFCDPARGASAAALSSPSTVSSPPRSRLISPTICGSGLRATPTPWLIGWPADLPLRGLFRCGRSRRTRSSSRCHGTSTRGFAPRARAITSC